MDNREKIREYLEKLGKAVSDCIRDSEEVKSLIKLLEEQGIQMNLGFVAMAGGPGGGMLPEGLKQNENKLEFKITSEDRAFLESLGIIYDNPREEESNEEKNDAEGEEEQNSRDE